jgi:hypothetical protein
MDLARYARHLRGAAVDLSGILADAMRVLGPRVKGYARNAMHKRSGLLSRAMDTSTTRDSLTLESLAISGPAYPQPGKQGGRRVKWVADYAAERGTVQAQDAMRFAQRQVVRLVRAGVRKRISTNDAPTGLGGAGNG